MIDQFTFLNHAGGVQLPAASVSTIALQAELTAARALATAMTAERNLATVKQVELERMLAALQQQVIHRRYLLRPLSNNIDADWAGHCV